MIARINFVNDSYSTHNMFLISEAFADFSFIHFSLIIFVLVFFFAEAVKIHKYFCILLIIISTFEEFDEFFFLLFVHWKLVSLIFRIVSHKHVGVATNFHSGFI